MKWQERNSHKKYTWHTGPNRHYYMARKNGVTYTVGENWSTPLSRSGPTVWWSHDGMGTNLRHKTKEEAMAWCEQHAAQRTRPTTPTRGSDE